MSGSGDYTLMVNRDAMMDMQDQSDPALAQEMLSAETAGRQWVIGGLDSLAPDYYALTVPTEGSLNVDAYTPASGGDLTLSLYDASGELEASSTGKSLHYKLPKKGAGSDGGLYTLQVSSDAGALDHVLGVKA